MYACATARLLVAMPFQIREEEHPERGGVAQDQKAHGGGGHAPDQDRAAAGAIAELPPDGHEEELHQRVDRAEQRGDQIARAVRARDAGQVRDHQPEPE
jgi:hypothetical protein